MTSEVIVTFAIYLIKKARSVNACVDMFLVLILSDMHHAKLGVGSFVPPPMPCLSTRDIPSIISWILHNPDVIHTLEKSITWINEAIVTNLYYRSAEDKNVNKMAQGNIIGGWSSIQKWRIIHTILDKTTIWWKTLSILLYFNLETLLSKSWIRGWRIVRVSGSQSKTNKAWHPRLAVWWDIYMIYKRWSL